MMYATPLLLKQKCKVHKQPPDKILVGCASATLGLEKFKQTGGEKYGARGTREKFQAKGREAPEAREVESLHPPAPS